MDFNTAIRAGLYRALDFKGRARRSEYWFFMLFALVCILSAISLDELMGTPSLGVLPEIGLPENYKQSLFVAFRISNGMIETVVALLLFIPLFSVLVRRLHDVGLPGHWAVLYYGVGFLSGPSVYKMFDIVQAERPQDITSDMMLIALLNLFVFAVFMIVTTRAGKKGPNQYGASPK